MNHLLLITDSFPPGFAPRMGYLVKFLKETGNWNVDVIAHELGDTSHPETFQHLCGFARNVWRYKVDDGIHGLSFKTSIRQLIHRQMSVSAWGKFLISKIVYAFIGLGVGFDIRAKIRAAIYANKYDLVLASSGGGQMSGLALYAARLSGVKLVLDFRDLYESRKLNASFWNDRQEWFRRKRRDFCVRRAEAIVTVIDQYVKFLCRYNPNVTLIRNGYDPDVFHEICPVKIDRFQLTYIGSVYDIPLWKPLNEGLILFLQSLPDGERANISIDFWTTPQTYEKNVLPYWDERLKQLMHYHAPVPQSEMLTIFQKTSISIGLSHNIQGQMEAIQTKLFEYFAMNRPVLNIGYQYDGDAEWMINDLHAGKVAVTPQEVAEFLIEKYVEWKSNGFVRGTIPPCAAVSYSRRSLSVEFEKVLSGMFYSDECTN